MLLAAIEGVLSHKRLQEIWEYEQESRDEESSLEMLSYEYEQEVRIPEDPEPTEGTCYGWLIFRCDEDAWVLDAQGFSCEEDELEIPEEGWSEETEEGVDYATYVRHGPECSDGTTCEDWFDEEAWPGVEDVPYDCSLSPCDECMAYTPKADKWWPCWLSAPESALEDFCNTFGLDSVLRYTYDGDTRITFPNVVFTLEYYDDDFESGGDCWWQAWCTAQGTSAKIQVNWQDGPCGTIDATVPSVTNIEEIDCPCCT